MGVALLYFSNQVNEHIIDYTDCLREGTEMTCADYIASIRKNSTISSEERDELDNCKCVINFNLTEDFNVSRFSYLV